MCCGRESEEGFHESALEGEEAPGQDGVGTWEACSLSPAKGRRISLRGVQGSGGISSREPGGAETSSGQRPDKPGVKETVRLYVIRNHDAEKFQTAHSGS